MTGKEFMQHLARGGDDMVAILLALLAKTGSGYCVIGGLGVNAYAEPVVSLDLDLVVVADRLDDLRREAEAAGMNVEAFETASILAGLDPTCASNYKKTLVTRRFWPAPKCGKCWVTR